MPRKGPVHCYSFCVILSDSGGYDHVAVCDPGKEISLVARREQRPVSRWLEEGLTRRVSQVCSADGDAKPLIFTFVPTLRRLPTHTRCVDTSQFLVRIPGDHSPETVNRPGPAAALSPGPAVQRDSAPGRCVPSAALEARGMQLGDVFQARCVLIVDSEGEDEAPDPALPGPLPRASSDVVRPKAPGPRPNAPGPTPKQPYKTTSSYKAFAAIPTNTLLLEQKALDEPIRTENVSKDSVLGLPVELCSPAQLRQQTEAVCAAIDKVLQDSLSMHSPDSPSKSLKIMLGSETIKTPTTVPRAAGRETKYANLSSASSGASESQLTKPGVIRPVPVRSRILLKNEEEVYEPNPFSKYLEDSSNLFSEQGLTVPPQRVSLHPLYQTKLYPPAKSLLQPAPPSRADGLTPGPFSHLSSSSLRDEWQNPHLLLGLGAYHKPMKKESSLLRIQAIFARSHSARRAAGFSSVSLS
ncbi:PREDICTED: muscular LMNA-interacting protein [Dipodomys ordii]|uniref:Muscular LMNA-interacting protein n=1 Tax=Dipodomys ordii TaxID=10020 RepID=A0A1S3FDF8_DIPOR|nr:PREDICTED: muscular LMNA-interacting protein [Dipodomys ordii]